MVDLTRWSRTRAQDFLDVAAWEFEALATQYRLREAQPGLFLAQDVAGLAESLTAAEHDGFRDWRTEFYCDGFAQLNHLVDDSHMDALDTWARARLVAKDNQPPGAEAMFGPTGRLVRVNYLDRDPESVALIRELPLLDLAQQLVNDPIMYRLSVVVRSNHIPPELGRHRDPRWTGRVHPDPVFAFGIHLESSPGDVGDVYYAPGSHKLAADGRLCDVDDVTLAEVTPATERGDAMVHNLGIVHGAYPYTAPRERITIYCSFASAREVGSTAWGPAPRRSGSP